MGMNIAQQLIKPHLTGGTMVPGEPVEPVIDPTLTRDVTGTW